MRTSVFRRVALIALMLALVAPLASLGQDDQHRVDVLVVSGPLDDRAVGFLLDTINAVAGLRSEVAIVQLDSPAVVVGVDRFAELLALVDDPPLPVVAWIGPAPATAYGGVLELAAAAPITLAAPGASVGYGQPVVLGHGEAASRLPDELHDVAREVTAPIPGVVDELAPSIRQLIQALDGRSVEVRGVETAIRTLASVEGGQEGEVTTVPVVFHEPGYWDRFLRLASTPEAAYFFLLVGLALAAFEFYAIGPGVAAGVAALSLFLGARGVATLPMRWWALALVLAGWAGLTASYQLGSVFLISAVGSLLLAVGGLFLVDGASQLTMSPVVTLLIVLGIVLFYVVAMPTVARSRFSTRTIGRQHLIGSTGTALADFDPDGEVEVAGARWRAAAHREAKIGAGDRVVVSAVDGVVLEVEKAAETVGKKRENHP